MFPSRSNVHKWWKFTGCKNSKCGWKPNEGSPVPNIKPSSGWESRSSLLLYRAKTLTLFLLRPISAPEWVSEEREPDLEQDSPYHSSLLGEKIAICDAKTTTCESLRETHLRKFCIRESRDVKVRHPKFLVKLSLSLSLSQSWSLDIW